MPGYKVKLTIKFFKTFKSTEIYRKRLKVSEPLLKKSHPDPNAKMDDSQYLTIRKEEQHIKQVKSKKVIAEARNMWTEIRKEGIDTGNKKTVITPESDGGNFGIQFEISGTYNGKPVKRSIVMVMLNQQPWGISNVHY